MRSIRKPKSYVLSKKMFFLARVGVIMLFGVTLLTRADIPPASNLSIDPIYAIYSDGADGNYIHIAFAIVNSGQTDVTVVTEYMNFGQYGVDKDTNSLMCTLSFDEPLTYKDKYLVIPSLYKYCPVTLKPGEAAMVNYFQDYSKMINFKGWHKEELQADNIIITYKIPSFWAKRFNLWEGELHSSPVKFTKLVSKSPIQRAH